MELRFHSNTKEGTALTPEWHALSFRKGGL